MPDAFPSPDDLRMRGFLHRTTVDVARDWVDRHAHSLPDTTIPLPAAAGRVLSQPLLAPIDVPGFDRSAMDGYALHADETIGASDYAPYSLRLVGDARPGRGWTGTLQTGEAVRIMTGAPLPSGADAVLPAELARLREDLQAVDVCAPVPPGKHVARTGEDLRRGSEVLPAGRRLRPQDVGVIASLGLTEVPVVRAPRVRMIITGGELVRPGMPLPPQHIYEANSFLLRALVGRDAGELLPIEFLADDPDAIRAAISAPGADILLISGGSSVGREDHAPKLVAELGSLDIHGLAMRPSSPAGLGRIGSTLVFLLPGNPVSCLCAYDFFAGRAIRRLGGLPSEWPYARITAPLVRKLVSELGRVDYCRVRVTPVGVEPLAISGAAILSSTTRADGFVVIPQDSEGSGAGEAVDVWLYG